MKTTILIAFLLLPVTLHGQGIKSLDLIFAGGCEHFTDRKMDGSFDYNERNISLIDGTAGIRAHLSDGMQIAAITYEDSYFKRAYAITFQKEVFRHGIIEGLFGVGATYKQVHSGGLRMFVWVPLPTIRLNAEPIKLDITPMPVMSGVVIMAYLSVNVM